MPDISYPHYHKEVQWQQGRVRVKTKYLIDRKGSLIGISGPFIVFHSFRMIRYPPPTYQKDVV